MNVSLVDCLLDCLVVGFDGLIGCLVFRCDACCLFACSIVLFFDLLLGCVFFVRLLECLVDFGMDCLVGYLMGRLIDCMIDCLIVL